MTDNDNEVEVEVEMTKEEYVAALQGQVLEILNKVKEELGVDTPIEIIVSEEDIEINE